MIEHGSAAVDVVETMSNMPEHSTDETTDEPEGTWDETTWDGVVFDG